MKLTLSLAFLAVAALIAPAAFPCGAPFGTGINVDPKQDIVVVHKNGVETYAFQPRFCGTASEFGLILPIPSKLSMAPALSKATVFTKVVALSEPEYRTQTICSTGGMRGGSTGATGGSGTSNGGTTVVSSGSVGFMDYSQLKADTTASFTDWLDKNGYPYDTLASNAFAYYVERGWYFLAFKISQGTVPSGTSVCKDLGPVKFSFPSDLPVVPTRMATARNRDATGALSYASQFSWRIFGITKGTQQIGFADGTNYQRTLGFSGIVPSADIPNLDGLAEAGDRLDRLTMTFSYGSTSPDIGLSLAPGTDYREVITNTVYVTCPDASVPDAPIGRSDSAILPDAGPLPVDTLPPLSKDAEPARPDAEGKLDTTQVPIKQDAGVTPDTAVTKPVQADAGVPISAPPDAAKPATTEEPSEKKSSGGCSLASGSMEHGLGALLVLALALVARRRRS
jgi:hypothetical protein